MFVSYANLFSSLIPSIVASPELHGKWLNTLSYLENCGARKIAACEHPTEVKKEMLKHAAEEFRHAHSLKRQIEKIGLSYLDYSLSSLLGGRESLHYLARLDGMVCRYLSRIARLTRPLVRSGAYLLVTYAIELRAGELYPIYETVLRKMNSKATVKSILLEEREHLKEMERALDAFPQGWDHAKQVVAVEGVLCRMWIDIIKKEILDTVHKAS